MIKKGKMNVSTRNHMATLENLFRSWFKRRHVDEVTRVFVRGLVEDMILVRKTYKAHMDSLPVGFDKSYDHVAYAKDVRNVDLYYSHWKREDLWGAKGSLKRVRQYELREGVEPFDERREREAKDIEIKRLSIKEGGCEFIN